MAAVPPIFNNTVDKAGSSNVQPKQSAANINNTQASKGDTFTKSDKVKLGLTSLTGGAIGAFAGLLPCVSRFEKIMDGKYYDKKAMDTFGESLVKHLRGEKVGNGMLKHMFFNSEFCPPETRAMEKFIKNNSLTNLSKPKEVKNLLKEYIAKDETMKEYFENYKGTVRFEAVTKKYKASPFKMAKCDDLLLKKLGKGAIKKYAAIVVAAGALAALAAGGITALILKQKNKSNSSQAQ